MVCHGDAALDVSLAAPYMMRLPDERGSKNSTSSERVTVFPEEVVEEVDW